MSNTITYDPTPVDQPEFSEEEQDSLAVGEKLAEQEQQLLAGKFRDAEQLEKAYLELQRKQGEQSSEEPETEETTEEEEETPDTNVLDRLWEEATNDNVSQETINELRSLDPDDLAKMHLEYRAEQQKQAPEQRSLSSEEATSLKSIAGGEQEYGQMIEWASDNLAESDVKMFNSVMDKGDPVACFFAVQALKYRFDEGTGFDGQMITGKTAPEKVDTFRSQAELVAAMSDPRYDRDPAYRNDVMLKLEQSNLNM